MGLILAFQISLVIATRNRHVTYTTYRIPRLINVLAVAGIAHLALSFLGSKLRVQQNLSIYNNCCVGLFVLYRRTRWNSQSRITASYRIAEISSQDVQRLCELLPYRDYTCLRVTHAGLVDGAKCLVRFRKIVFMHHLVHRLRATVVPRLRMVCFNTASILGPLQLNGRAENISSAISSCVLS